MKWISVSDKLPEKGVHVITAEICGHDHTPEEVRENWITVDKRVKSNGKYIRYDSWAQGFATHWIPMPDSQ